MQVIVYTGMHCLYAGVRIMYYTSLYEYNQYYFYEERYCDNRVHSLYSNNYYYGV